MRVRHDHLLMRLLGVATGVGFIGLGLAVNGASGGLAVALLLGGAGAAAIVASLIVVDPSRVW